MWKLGILVFVCSFAVYSEGECIYGEGCIRDCPDNCGNLTNTSMHCDKDNGRCIEGCKKGFYGYLCYEPCSKNCKRHICNQHNGHCSLGCIENHIGDFCETAQGITFDSHSTLTTRATTTSAGNVGIQVIIPVVVTVLVLVGFVSTVIILIRCRRREVLNPEGQELLAITDTSHCNQVQREDTNLHVACKLGKADEVKHVLSKTNINSRGLYGWTPLMAAARYGQRGVFDLLVSKRCDEVMDDDFGNNILHIACLGGDLKLVKSILSKKIVGINSRGHCGRTPIMAAARVGHKHVLKTLLSCRCDASLIDDVSNNILHYACIGGHIGVVVYILNKNIVGINSKGEHGMTPVIVSAEVGHSHVFDFLVHKGADLSQVDDNGNNILHVACIGGNLEIAKHILSQDLIDINSSSQDLIDINSRGQDGRTSVMAAAEPRCSEVFELLVNKGADLSLVDNYGNSILHVAISRGNMDMVKYLLAKDSADINSRGQNGRTPLMCAVVSWQQNAMIDFLLSKSADASIIDDDGNNILHYACIGGHMEVVQYILDKNIVDINSKGKNGMTPVMIAAEVGHRDVFDFLVHEGADLSQEDDNGNTSLHLACLSGCVMTVKYILPKNIIDINSKGQFRRTPVMMAAQAKQRDVFVLLVSKGADMSHVDEHDDNVLHLASRVGHLEMVKLVLSHGIVDIDCTGRYMRTPVMMAAENGHEEVYNVLVREEANLSNKDANGNNILHLACLGGSESIVQHILSKNVLDITAMNNDGSKAVTIATEQGHRSIYELLCHTN